MGNTKKNSRQKLRRDILNGADAEFLLQQASKGKWSIRVGRIWKIPRTKGTSVILLDFDNCSTFDKHALIQRLNICGIKTIDIRKKKSPGGKGLHIAITVRGKLAPFAIVALQCICESDPIREAQNFRRALCMKGEQWMETGNVLFTTT